MFCCEQACAGVPTPTPHVDGDGRQVFDSPGGQFIIVVEGRIGASGQSVGVALEAVPPDGRPDLQIQATVPQGNGSRQVCDVGSPPFGGGVPGIVPPRFDSEPLVTDALRDLACRFEVFPRGSPCTIVDPSGQSGFIGSNSTVQFCDIIAATALFPPGEALITARLRDVGGETGPERQIIVRVATPTATPVSP